MKHRLTVVWRDVSNGVVSRYEFSNPGECFIPSPQNSCSKVPNLTFTKPETKGESRKQGSGGRAPAEDPVSRSLSKRWHYLYAH